MKKAKLLTYLILSLLVRATPSLAQDGTTIEISGKVTDQEKKDPLPDVSVQIKGSLSGTVTNHTGDFKLRTRVEAAFYPGFFIDRV